MRYLYILFCLSFACSTKNEPLVFALQQAKQNRIELEKVLNHYKSDSLKYKATVFLIENMYGNYTYNKEVIKKCTPFYKQYDSLAKVYNYEMNMDRGRKIDSLWKQFYVSNHFSSVEFSFSTDLQTITSEQLITEIDLAFKSWQENAYTKNISFDDFCEYILPYRRQNGLLIDNMRSVVYERHRGKFFTKEGKEMINEADSLLWIYKHLSHSQFWGTKIPIYDASTFEYLQRGLCANRCWYNSILFSSLGMAVAIDFVPAWGNRNNSHTWNVLIKDGKSYAFESFWDEDRWKYKTIYNNRTFDHLWGKFRLPKVYRKTYRNYFEGPFFDKRVKEEDVPPLFKDFKKKDVSDEYFETSDVTLILQEVPEGVHYAYLCVFGYQSWHPVQWGKIEGNKVSFKKMGRDIVYQPAFYRGNKIDFVSSPFLLKLDGDMKNLSGEDNLKNDININQVKGAVNYDYNRKNIHSLSESVVLGENTKTNKLDTLLVLPKSIPMESSVYKSKYIEEYQKIVFNFTTDTTALSEVVFYDDKNQKIKIEKVTSKSINESELNLLYDGVYVSGIKKKNTDRQIQISFSDKQKVSFIRIMPFINPDTGDDKIF